MPDQFDSNLVRRAVSFAAKSLYIAAPEGVDSFRFISNDSFELTIVNNGIPAYSSLKRVYNRVSMLFF